MRNKMNRWLMSAAIGAVVAATGAGSAAAQAASDGATTATTREEIIVPYRAAMEQGLIYTRLGNPIGQAEIAERGPDRPEPRFR